MPTKSKAKGSLPRMSPEVKTAYMEIQRGARSLGKSIAEIQQGLRKAEREIEAAARARIQELRKDVRAQLAGLDGPLVGVRHQVHDEADPEWLLRDDVQRGLAAVEAAGLVYDLLVRARELPASVETVRRHPGLSFVLDHAGKAPHDGRDAWAQGVAALAELPNVTCKLSGLFTEADPEGTVALALCWFGADRCMFGSDWPVCLLASEYADAITVVGHDPDVLAGTAIRTYGLDVP